MQRLVSLIVLSVFAIRPHAFTFPRQLNSPRTYASVPVLKATTIDTPSGVVEPITIDQIFPDPIVETTDSKNRPIKVAAIGGVKEYAALPARRTKTVSIYKDTSCDIDDTLTTLGKKSPLLFLPGLDGVGNYSAGSVGKLNLIFDVWKMATKGDDRSTFLELAAVVLKGLDTFDEPVVLIGESFGGLLAAYVALRAKEGKISKLVLINPATSFDRTNWNVLAPIIASTGRAFPLIGMSALLATAVDMSQIQRVGLRVASKLKSPAIAVDVFTNLFNAGIALLDLIPAETLNWRIQQWFTVGTSIMRGKYSQIKVPTLILVGKNDRLLPSLLEGRRLKKEMTSSKQVEVKEFDIGHALLEEDFIDFGDIILKSDIFAIPREDPLLAPFPTKEDMVDVEKQV